MVPVDNLVLDEFLATTAVIRLVLGPPARVHARPTWTLCSAADGSPVMAAATTSACSPAMVDARRDGAGRRRLHDRRSR
jgi:hypothetical protein